MKKYLFTILFSTITIFDIVADNMKRVAILEPVDKIGSISYGTKLLLRQSITYAITQTPGYEGYNRIDMTQIMQEHDFQRTGYVSDDQIKKLGIMTGAAFVLIAEVAPYDTEHIVVLANLVNVESGQIENSSTPIITKTDPENMSKSCSYLAEILLNIRKNRFSSYSSNASDKGQVIVHSTTISSIKNYTETLSGVDIPMVWVEGGEFKMGCTGKKDDCREDERIIRTVSISEFYIGMFEITQAQWTAVMGTTLSEQKDKTNYMKMYGVGDTHPMYYISWEEAMEFCRLLSKKTGKTYTLPTEAQWEYAARGGNRSDETEYAGSNQIESVAWYNKNSFSTNLCGTKSANSLGIYDMSGNVSEWCKDWYANNYQAKDTNNPSGVTIGTQRVRRGGGWEDGSRNCRVSNRCYDSPNTRSYNIGFRIVCIP